MDAYAIAAALHAYREDGVTVDENGVADPHKVGYYVGGLCPSLVFDSVNDVDRGEVAWWVGTHPASYYGVWADSETGKVYIDAVSHMQHLETALNLAKARKELAVWDILGGNEIRVANDV